MNALVWEWFELTCTSHDGAKTHKTDSTSFKSAGLGGTTTPSRELNVSNAVLFFKAQRMQRVAIATLGMGQFRRSQKVLKDTFSASNFSVSINTAETSSSESETADSEALICNSRPLERVTLTPDEVYNVQQLSSLTIFKASGGILLKSVACKTTHTHGHTHTHTHTPPL